MPHLDLLSSAAGGVLIGLSASAMLALLGRVAGISGIVGGLLTNQSDDRAWRAAFVAGLMTGGVLLAASMPSYFVVTLDRSVPVLIVAGLLIGFGTRMGNGCTSGHGVCGLARGSTRSLVATITFMATGMLVALVVTQLFGGTL